MFRHKFEIRGLGYGKRDLILDHAYRNRWLVIALNSWFAPPFDSGTMSPAFLTITATRVEG